MDVLELFEADEQTELIVLSGEIGGSAEEEAAEYIAEHVSKPVVAYIAGFTAPAGKQMGHAGAIVSGSAGTAAAKAQALEAKGVRVGRTPTEAAEIAVEVLGGAVTPLSARGVGSCDGRRSKTLGELERKLQELERTLTSIDRGSQDGGDAPPQRSSQHRPRPAGSNRRRAVECGAGWSTRRSSAPSRPWPPAPPATSGRDQLRAVHHSRATAATQPGGAASAAPASTATPRDPAAQRRGAAALPRAARARRPAS